ncbi:MAG TPA: AAA family ATPase [Rhodopila sp.]|nr:AAA family ATPase [Rhodopila sp.]
MLIVFGGLSGTGKTTISRALVARCSAVFLRVDVIEQAIRLAGVLAGDVGPAGYVVANALAASNLANGRMVIADCVNPVSESRGGWRQTAAKAQVRLIEVEVICSDPVEHRRRVEGREADIDGLVLPRWQDVLNRRYDAWPEAHMVVDTACLGPEEAVGLVEGWMRP